ncbi:MAG: hypothetical protein KJ905_00865 [Nanoarchaeota archaeon]|nr:hypothetical protein [Nanoarchaeota archaeon]MBU1501310.1 hypothetical protein [Nanoarchaeota archaeon]MBU2459421.1 hypothetical protein [Nanoarchaeota archaeon]
MELRVNIPEEIRIIIEKNNNIDWSRVARVAVLKKIQELEFLKNFSLESEFAEKDALEFGKRVNKKVVEKYKEM